MADNQSYVQGAGGYPTRDFQFPADATLLSVTDTQSYIRYANNAFLTTAGYTRDQLLGQPHNIVRHPDMPREAFADLWATLQRGDTWTALVKNLRANGEQHYWVRANVTPIRSGGEVVGYLSVRTRPEQAEIDAAEELYRAFREGRAQKKYAFHKGLVVRKGLVGWLSRQRQTLKVGHCVRLALLGVGVAGAAPIIAGGLPWWLAAAPVLATLAAGAWLQARIVRPMSALLQQATAVAAGHVDTRLHANRVDEIGMAARAVNQAGLNLRSLIGDVAAQIEGMQNNNEQILYSNHELKYRTEQTADQLQETTQAAQQMSAALDQSAQITAKAHELAEGASAAVTQGGQAIAQVVETMRDIARTNERIAETNRLIDSIAAQTNLLALNAAVEAARAGPAGRGFAVVANEVRGLAQRSAEAATEIRNLVDESVQKSHMGALQAEETGSIMADIVQRVHQVDSLLSDLAGTADEQNAGVGQLSQSISEIDRMTQENAKAVQQFAMAVQGIIGRTDLLAEALRVFESNKQAPETVAAPRQVHDEAQQAATAGGYLRRLPAN
ncbi:methyl-accepting chemotaxis protein [Achromobacter sp. F4_2707]|uniref:methyl-accepting chemotaxis protein n=1 Tax=Achromobacter sp. F4_2707 TaxID=3114286 RepID=UPI0039C6A451